MADLKFTISGDASDAKKAFNDLRDAVTSDARAIRTATGQVATSTKTDFDVVFRQLTQFRIGLTQLGRGDLGGVPNLIKGIQLAGAEVADVVPKVASAKQAFSILDAALQTSGFKATTAKTLFQEFKESVKLAATGSSAEAVKLRTELEKFGVNATIAIAKPEQAFTSFLKTLSSSKNVASLDVLNVDNKGLISSLQRAGQVVTQFESAETSAAAGAEVLSAGLSTTTLAIGGVVAVAAIAAAALVALEVEAIKLGVSFAEQARGLREVQDATGLSVQTLQEYGAAGKITGLQLSDLVSAQDKLIEKLKDSDDKGEEFRKRLLAIGVSADNLNKPAQVLEQLLPKLQSFNEDANVSAVAIDLFDKNVSKAVNTSKELEANNGALKKTFQELGVVAGGEAVQGGIQLERQLAILDVAATGLKNRIGVELVPTITQGLALVVVAVNELGPAFRIAGQVANAVLVAVIAEANVLKNEVHGLYETLAGLLTLDFSRAGKGIAQQFSTNFATESAKIVAEQQKLKDSFNASAADAEKNAQAALAARLARAKQLSAIGNESKKALTPRLNLKDFEGDLRNQERLYRVGVEQAQRAFQERFVSETAYTERLIALAQSRLEAEKQILADEEKAINASKIKPEEKERDLRAVARKREDIERATTDEIERINFDSRQRIRQGEQQLQAEILQTLIQANNNRINTIQEFADRQVLSQQEAERRITAVIIESLDARIALQQAAVDNAGVNEQQRAIELQKLKQLEAEKAKAVQDSTQKIRDARKRDIQSERDHLIELRNIQNETAKTNLEALITDQGIKRVDAIRASAAIERQIIREQADERIAALQRQLEANAQFIAEDEAQKEQQIANEKRLTELITAENALRDAKLNENRAQEKKDVQAQNKTLGDALANGRDAVKANAKAILGSLLSGQTSVRQAAQSFYDSLTAPLADYLIDEGIGQSVLAAKDLANLNFPGAALHAAAAAALFGGAALIGAGSRAIGGNSAGAGGGASSLPSLTGTRQDENTQSTEERIRFRESGALRPVTTIVIQHETGMFLSKVETALRSSYQNDGTAKKIIDNANSGRPI